MSVEVFDPTMQMPPPVDHGVAVTTPSEKTTVCRVFVRHKRPSLAEYIVGLDNKNAEAVRGQEHFFTNPPPSGIDVYNELQQSLGEIDPSNPPPRLHTPKIMNSPRVMPDTMLSSPSHRPRRG